MGEASIRKFVSNFLYDSSQNTLYHRSALVKDPYRKVLAILQLIEEMETNHCTDMTDHRKSDAVYETLCTSFFQ